MQITYKNHNGMTLVEIMVVLVIIGLMFSGVVLGIGSLEKERLRSSVMDVASAFRYAYTQSAITGKGYRIVLDLDNNLFYLEEAEPGRVLISEEEDDLEEDEPQNEESNPEVKKEDTESKTTLNDLLSYAQLFTLSKIEQSQDVDMNLLNQLLSIDLQHLAEDNTPRYKRPRFHRAKERLGKNQPLEDGIEFKKVYATHYKYPKEEGKAYIYFFPGGDAEHAVVQLMAPSGIIHSVEVLPLTGEIKTHDIPIELEDYGEEVE